VVFLRNKAKQFKTEFRKLHSLTNEKIKKLEIPATLSIGLKKHVREKKYYFIARLISTIDEGINEKDFSKAFPYIQRNLEVLEKFSNREYEGSTCTTFVFKSEGFIPVGQLILPSSLALSPDLTEKLGEIELSGFNLSFRKSPLGLDALNISIEDERLEIRPTFTSKFATVKDLTENTFIHAKETSLLFVEKKK